jgi:ABC-2 type transport system permease protein
MAAIPSLLAQRGVFGIVAAVCRWLPPGAAMHAGADAAAGRWVFLAVDLAIAVAGVGAALAWWSRGMGAALVGQAGGAGSRRTGTPSALYPRWLGWLPRTRGAAVFVREVRYAARSPYRRASIALGIVSGSFLGLSPMLLGGDPSGAVFGGCWIAAIYAISFGNPLGYEGRSLWLHHAVPGRSSSDWAGRIAAALVIGAIPAALVSTAAAALTDRWALLPAALGLSVVILAVECGTGAILGIALPYAMPDVDANPFNTGSGGGVRAILALVVCGLSALVLGAPVIGLVALSLLGWAPGSLLAGVVGLVYSPLLVFLASRAAGALHDRRAPEVLAVVAPRT